MRVAFCSIDRPFKPYHSTVRISPTPYTFLSGARSPRRPRVSQDDQIDPEPKAPQWVVWSIKLGVFCCWGSCVVRRTPNHSLTHINGQHLPAPPPSTKSPQSTCSKNLFLSSLSNDHKHEVRLFCILSGQIRFLILTDPRR